MNKTVIINGTEYTLRCDLNVIEKIEEEYGTVAELIQKVDVKAVKFLVAVMINEHYYYIGDNRRITADKIGAEASMADFAALSKTAIDCLIGCARGNAQSAEMTIG